MTPEELKRIEDFGCGCEPYRDQGDWGSGPDRKKCVAKALVERLRNVSDNLNALRGLVLDDAQRYVALTAEHDRYKVALREIAGQTHIAGDEAQAIARAALKDWR